MISGVCQRPCRNLKEQTVVWTSHPVSQIAGRVQAPGDKSCSHRALILGGMASGQTHVTGLLEGDDVLRTGHAVQALGAQVERREAGVWVVTGAGVQGFRSPSQPLDFGNSGTGSRLMMGAMAGYNLAADILGDASLSVRPMNRVLTPLREMGARDTASDAGTLPFRLMGSSNLNAISYTPPHASAQVKSAVLLAGLNAEGVTEVLEAKATRDHTERMLRGFGARVEVERPAEGGRIVAIKGGQRLEGIEMRVPGDPSSAAFLVAAALMAPAGETLIQGVMSNETRGGFFDAAASMGAVLGADAMGEAAGERMIDMTAAASDLKGISVPPSLVPSMIDEFPILAALAAFANGETIVSGAEELRVKESDRITATIDLLRVNGVEVEERPDGFIVQGCGGPPPGGGLVETRHDHRIAMSALVMGTASQKPVSVDDISMIDTSYPEFFDHMRALGADIRDVPA